MPAYVLRLKARVKGPVEAVDSGPECVAWYMGGLTPGSKCQNRHKKCRIYPEARTL